MHIGLNSRNYVPSDFQMSVQPFLNKGNLTGVRGFPVSERLFQSLFFAI